MVRDEVPGVIVGGNQGEVSRRKRRVADADDRAGILGDAGGAGRPQLVERGLTVRCYREHGFHVGASEAVGPNGTYRVDPRFVGERRTARNPSSQVAGYEDTEGP